MQNCSKAKTQAAKRQNAGMDDQANKNEMQNVRRRNMNDEMPNAEHKWIESVAIISSNSSNTN